MRKFEYKFLGPASISKMLLSLRGKSKTEMGSLEVFNILGAEGWEFKTVLAGNNLFMREIIQEPTKKGYDL